MYNMFDKIISVLQYIITIIVGFFNRIIPTKQQTTSEQGTPPSPNPLFPFTWGGGGKSIKIPDDVSIIGPGVEYNSVKYYPVFCSINNAILNVSSFNTVTNGFVISNVTLKPDASGVVSIICLGSLTFPSEAGQVSISGATITLSRKQEVTYNASILQNLNYTSTGKVNSAFYISLGQAAGDERWDIASIDGGTVTINNVPTQNVKFTEGTVSSILNDVPDFYQIYPGFTSQKTVTLYPLIYQGG